MHLNTVEVFAGNTDTKKDFGEDNFSYAWEVLPIVLKNIEREISYFLFLIHNWEVKVKMVP